MGGSWRLASTCFARPQGRCIARLIRAGRFAVNIVLPAIIFRPDLSGSPAAIVRRFAVNISPLFASDRGGRFGLFPLSHRVSYRLPIPSVLVLLIRGPSAAIIALQGFGLGVFFSARRASARSDDWPDIPPFQASGPLAPSPARSIAV